MPKDATTLSKSNLRKEHAECEEGDEQRRIEEEKRNGDTWSDGDPFILVTEVSPILKSRLGLAANRDILA